jgi:serine/threonine-protein kinase RsbW
MIIKIPSNPAELKIVRSKIEIYCKDNFKKIEIFKIKLSVDEALQNVIKYAYKMDKTKKIVVTLEKISDESLKIKIRDYGLQAPIENIKSRSLKDVKPGGLGVHFMKSSTKKMSYEHQKDGGTLLTLIF